MPITAEFTGERDKERVFHWPVVKVTYRTAHFVDADNIMIYDSLASVSFSSCPPACQSVTWVSFIDGFSAREER